MNPQVDWNTVWLLLPELLLVLLAVWAYVAGAFSHYRNGSNAILLAGLILGGYLLTQQNPSHGLWDGTAVQGNPIFSGPLIVDPFGHTIRWLVLVVGGLMLLSMWRAGPEDLSTEYTGSLFLILAGLMIVTRTDELVLLFLGLELVSIPTYIMLFIGRQRTAAHEATTKYFYLGILSSGLLLYGFALLYGATGTMQLREMPDVLAISGAGGGTLIRLAPAALVLVIAGLGFKMAAVPFHFYAPDVYEGTTAANAGLLSVAPKIAGLIALVRIMLAGFMKPDLLELGWQMALALALMTMTLGNVMALLQNNVRRMMAYSAISHAGYLFIGVAVALAVASGEVSSANVGGISAALFYLVAYALATLGIFATFVYLAGADRELDHIDELAGLSKSRPMIALSMTICLLSLTGVPPLAGFWGKLELFFCALCFDPKTVDIATRNWFGVLVIVGAMNAAISAGYYLRLVGVMYFRPAGKSVQPTGGSGPMIAAIASAVLVIAIGMMPAWFFERTNRAAEPWQPIVATTISNHASEAR
ncbi:MAG: NADH-quinone oxidoreductase subunit N [Pirellulales bacterium]|nr:NADH-quinone oxidoreductase subunit N [Pirellulales bacterium]